MQQRPDLGLASISPSGVPVGLPRARLSPTARAIEGAETGIRRAGRRLRLTCVVVGLLIALGMGACGGDDEASGLPEPPAVEGAPESVPTAPPNAQ